MTSWDVAGRLNMLWCSGTATRPYVVASERSQSRGRGTQLLKLNKKPLRISQGFFD